MKTLKTIIHPYKSVHTQSVTLSKMLGVEGLDGKQRYVIPVAPSLTGHTVVLCLQQKEELEGRMTPWMLYCTLQRPQLTKECLENAGYV